MTNDIKKNKKKKNEQDFYEVMPGAFMHNYEMFPAHVADDEAEQPVKQKMARQIAIMVGLLVVQLILFAVLIQSTMNLG